MQSHCLNRAARTDIRDITQPFAHCYSNSFGRRWVEVQLYSSMTAALERVSGQQHAPAAIYPRERPGTHFTGGWVGPRAGLDGRKISFTPGFNPGQSSPYSVAIPTKLPGPHTHIYIYICVCVCVRARVQGTVIIFLFLKHGARNIIRLPHCSFFFVI